MMPRVYTRTPTIERLVQRIVIDDNGCWIWQGAIQSGGYGQIISDDKAVYTHRVTYSHYVGPIPEGLHIDHLCRVRACCNPEHLEAVTCRENSLRGEAGLISGAQQLAKTHCPQGHEYLRDELIRERRNQDNVILHQATVIMDLRGMAQKVLDVFDPVTKKQGAAFDALDALVNGAVGFGER